MSNRSAHHYMRTYQSGLWNRVNGNYYSRRDDFCVGSVKRHKRALELVNEFIDTYQNRAKNLLTIMHYIENSHDGNERTNWIDDDIVQFLDTNMKNVRFNNTAIFLYR